MSLQLILVLELVGLLPPPGTGPVLLHVGQGLCVVVPGEGLDAVLVEAAEDAAQPRLLQEALVLLHGSDVVTQPEKKREKQCLSGHPYATSAMRGYPILRYY